MKTILLSHNKVGLNPHKVILTGLGRTSAYGAKNDVLKSLSNLAISSTKPIKHLVGGASAFTPARIPSVIRKSPIGKIF